MEPADGPGLGLVQQPQDPLGELGAAKAWSAAAGPVGQPGGAVALAVADPGAQGGGGRAGRGGRTRWGGAYFRRPRRVGGAVEGFSDPRGYCISARAVPTVGCRTYGQPAVVVSLRRPQEAPGS